MWDDRGNETRDHRQCTNCVSCANKLIIISKLFINFVAFLKAAADVRFDESLKESIETNVRGTRDIITLTHQIKNLIVFIYMSTAFTNCNRPIVEEKFYRTMIDPDFMIKLVESIPEAACDEFQVMAKRIIQPYPNTYTYTKALAEQIVRKYANNLPIAIIRPSIVTTTFRDPIAGKKCFYSLKFIVSIIHKHIK